MVKIRPLLAPERTVKLTATVKDAVLEELANKIIASPLIEDADKFMKAMYQREQIMSTGIGLGIAVPHIRHETVKDMIVGIGISKKGIDFNSLDKKPAHIIFMIASPKASHREYLHLLAKITSVLQDESFREKLIAADVPEGVLELLKDD